MDQIRIVDAYITLGQMLKKAGWIDTGGQAREALRKLDVSVNGERESRRGRKLYPGDTVVIEGRSYAVMR